jgi:hypothetical protein
LYCVQGAQRSSQTRGATFAAQHPVLNFHDNVLLACHHYTKCPFSPPDCWKVHICNRFAHPHFKSSRRANIVAVFSLENGTVIRQNSRGEAAEKIGLGNPISAAIKKERKQTGDDNGKFFREGIRGKQLSWRREKNTHFFFAGKYKTIKKTPRSRHFRCQNKIHPLRQRPNYYCP